MRVIQQSKSLTFKKAASYSTATFTTTFTQGYTYDRAWFDCELSRTSLGPVSTGIDGVPRRSAFVATTECSEPSQAPVITSGTTTSIIGYPNQPEKWDLATAACGELCGQCNIMNGGFLDVLYWPVSLGYSGNSSYTITPTATEPVTMVYGTVTLTSPTVYISYSTLFAGYGFFTNVNAPDASCASQYKGGRYSNIIIPIPTDQPLTTYDLSYSEFAVITQTSSRFNYADLPPNPLPAEKWSQSCSFLFNMNQTTGAIHGPKSPGSFPMMTLPGDPDLTWHPCSTVTDGVYRPLLRQPLAVRDFDPAWRNCQFLELDGLIAPRDPPFALTRQIPINAPTFTTMDSKPTQIAAEPAHEPSMFVPETTEPGLSVPQPTQTPGGDPGAGGDGAGGSGTGDTGSGSDSGPPYSGGGSIVGPGSGNNDVPNDGTPQPPAATFTIGTQAFTAHPSTPITLPGVTLQPSAGVATVSGHTISLAASGVVIDGTLAPFVTPVSRGSEDQAGSDDIPGDSNYTPKFSNNPTGGTNIVAIEPNGPIEVNSGSTGGTTGGSSNANDTPESDPIEGSDKPTASNLNGGGDDIMNIEGGTNNSGGQNRDSPGESTSDGVRLLVGEKRVRWYLVMVVCCLIWLV